MISFMKSIQIPDICCEPFLVLKCENYTCHSYLWNTFWNTLSKCLSPALTSNKFSSLHLHLYQKTISVSLTLCSFSSMTNLLISRQLSVHSISRYRCLSLFQGNTSQGIVFNVRLAKDTDSISYCKVHACMH